MASIFYRILFALIFPIVGAFLAQSAIAETSTKIGIVLMHGKGGSPMRHIADLVSPLEGQGYLVASPGLEAEITMSLSVRLRQKSKRY